MKAVLLFGSPRKDGFTGMLAEKYISSLPESCSVRRFDAYDLMAEPCRACGVCAQKDFCPHDDLDELFEALYESDLLIIASPVYYLSFPAPLKAIIDRMQRLHEADRRGDNRMRAKMRRGVVLLTAGAPSEKGDIIRQQLRWVAGPLGIAETTMVVCPDTDRLDEHRFAALADEKISELHKAE